MKTEILMTTCLFWALTVNASAQNLISSPPPGLEGNRNQIGQKIRESKDENFLVQVIQIEGDNEDFRYLKMLAAKRLSIYGTEKCIPALIQMLSHPQMGYYSRYALEPIPYAAVDEALREETKKQKRMNLVGVLTSLGVRRDAGAVPFLEPLLDDADSEVVKATYAAYGYIGTPECAEFLKKAVADFKPNYEKAVCDAAMGCAKRLTEAGNIDQALSVYDAILDSKARSFIKEGAIFNRILIRKTVGTDDLIHYLHSEDIGIFEAALQTVRLLSVDDDLSVCQVLTAELDKFPLRRKGLILEALAGRKDDESRKAALAIATTVKEPETVRVSAMNALGTLNIPEAVPTLLEGASDNGGQGTVAQAAFRSLIFMTNKGADAAIAKAMTAAGNKIDATMIRIARERRAVATSPQLWTIVAMPNSPLRDDAIDALGETATQKDLPEMTNLIDTAKNDEERKRVDVALRSICARMPQQACCDEIIAILNKNSTRKVKETMIDLLRIIGGQAAVKQVTEIALDDNVALADKATQILGTWDSHDTMAEIAESMLKVAQQSREPRFRIRGVRGYIRLARQFSYPETQRIAMIRTAFDTATRPEDKVLIFDIFTRYPSPKMLEAAMSYSSEKGYEEKACAAAVSVAGRLEGRRSQAARIMEDVIKLTKNAETKSKAELIRDKFSSVVEDVEIVKAVYGAGDQQIDVTVKVRE